MSGYAAIVRRDGSACTGDDLAPLVPPLRARGPHGAECWTLGSVGVATTLLDVGDARLLPRVVRVPGRLVVAGQVRVDARDELIRALRDAGTPAEPRDADIALFAKTWLTWGERSIDRILGDFSVMVHEQATRTTTLARDPFGVRMLYYHVKADRVMASNTIDAVLAHSGVSRALNDDAIADVIAVGFNESAATTTFRDVQRVPPGHLVRIPATGAPLLVKHFELPAPKVERRDIDHPARFRDALERSVRDRCRARSVVVLASGGVDSSALVAVGQHVQAPAARVIALTIDTSALAPTRDVEGATLVATQAGVDHVVFDAGDYGVREGVDDAGFHTPEPGDDPDVALWRAIALRALDHSNVLLYGEDPDALLAPPDLSDMFRVMAPWRVGVELLTHVVQTGRRPHLGIRDTLARTRGLDAAEDVGTSWLRADLRAQRAERRAARREADHPTRPEVARRLAQPVWQKLLESLDAGHHGVPVDVRLPYLDRPVVERALSAPPMPWLQHKRLLRDAVKGLIPESVRTAPKQGQPGLYEARLAQWRARKPRPFEPSPMLRDYLDAHALNAARSPEEPRAAQMEIRLRLLDRWLRERATGRG